MNHFTHPPPPLWDSHLVRAACLTTGCTNKCFVYAQWCSKTGTKIEAYVYTPAIVTNGCTDQATAGTGVLNVETTWIIYDDCGPDCITDYNNSDITSGPKLGTHVTDTGSGYFKGTCKTGS